LTIILSWCIDGGLDWALVLLGSASITLVSPDLGFVTNRLFSCSSLASNNAVD
jgi:hypothetical protein